MLYFELLMHVNTW